MPIFADEVPTKKFDVPAKLLDDGERFFFEVKMLSWKEVEQCRSEAQRKEIGQMKQIGGDLIKAIGDVTVAPDDEDDSEDQAAATAKQKIAKARAENQRKAAVESLDPALLVQKSVVGWSLQDNFQPRRLEKLTEAIFQWLFGEIVKLYLPEPDEAAAEGKDDAEPSLIG